VTTDPPLREGIPPATPLESSPQQQAPAETARIARAAGTIALGNVASRVLGLVRETVKSHFFGAGGAVDAFSVASIVPTMLYDLLVGGMVNSSLVPVFSEYTEERRGELWGLVSAVLGLTIIVMAVFTLVVELFAPQVAFVLSSGSSQEVLELTARLLRITVPAVLFLSLSGVLSGLLYALKRFTFPAFAAAVFNAGIVFVTLAFHRRLGITAMAVGLLVGAILQMGLQLGGLRDANLRLRVNLVHPGLRQVVMLYIPIALGLLVDILIGRPISYNLASQTGEGGISWMNYATYLRQLPQGLVATAVSFAVLPTLSAHANKERSTGDGGPFQITLAQGLRLVTVLIIPASLGLFILARPTVALLYEHGDFLALDTRMTSLALQYYLLGLPFAAVDLLLVFAFYARQDTLTPSLIGIGTVVAYLGVAIVLMPVFGLFSLMIADSFKQLLHMLVSGWILGRRLGGLGKDGIYRTLGIALVAAAAMGIATYGTLTGIELFVPGRDGLIELLSVVGPGVVGVIIYLGLITVLRVEEVHLFWRAIRRRVMRSPEQG
jgi:putative peptidoglycan lipid II flippase